MWSKRLEGHREETMEYSSPWKMAKVGRSSLILGFGGWRDQTCQTLDISPVRPIWGSWLPELSGNTFVLYYTSNWKRIYLDKFHSLSPEFPQPPRSAQKTHLECFPWAGPIVRVTHISSLNLPPLPEGIVTHVSEMWELKPREIEQCAERILEGVFDRAWTWTQDLLSGNNIFKCQSLLLESRNAG